MNFLVDAQLPPGLAHWLAEQGHSAQHVLELGFAEAEDITIWKSRPLQQCNNCDQGRRLCRANGTYCFRSDDRLATHRQFNQSSTLKMAQTAMVGDHRTSQRREQAHRSALNHIGISILKSCEKSSFYRSSFGAYLLQSDRA